MPPAVSFLYSRLLPITALALGVFAAPATRAADDVRVVEDASKIASENVRDPSLPTVFLVGDSTVKVGTSGQRGWGEEIAHFFDLSKVNVVNRAIGGRSSRTFITQGRWDKVLADLKAGDFVIVQFGHNDGGAINDDSRARGSIKGIGEQTEEIDNLLTKQHEVVHSYGWYMRKYVADTQAKKATPIVCSLVPRKIWKEGKIERSTDSYAQWAQQVAEQSHALFLDLHEIIARKYEAAGPETVETYFADHHTHTTKLGAQVSAEAVVAGLKALPGNPLAPYFSEDGNAVKPYVAQASAK